MFKRITALIFFFLYSFSVTDSCLAEFNTYRDDNLGFEISFPKNWEKVKSPNPNGSSFFLVKIPDEKLATINILIKETDIDQNQFKRAVLDYPKNIDAIRERISTAKFIDAGETLLAGFSAFFIKFQYSGQVFFYSIDITSLSVGFIHNGKGYKVVYEAETKFFEDFYDEYFKIMDTFKLRPEQRLNSTL